MNKRIKKKILKGKFWYHKGQMLWQHHAYQADPRTREVLLCYDIEAGCEFYFKGWKDAKYYLRRMKVFNTIAMRYYSPLITVDDIPF